MEQQNYVDCWMKLGEAAFALGTSEITLRRKLKSGKIQYESRDGKYYILLSKDSVSGRILEPISENSYTTSPALSTRQNTPVSTPAVNNNNSPIIAHLSAELKRKDQTIASLKRIIEDHETLINTLEASIK